MIRMNWWLTALKMDVIKKKMINENVDDDDQNIGSDDYDQDDAIENNSEDLINVLQNVNLSFGNLEGMSEGEKTTI